MKPSATTYDVCTHLDSIFTGNKPSHAVHIEVEFQALTQGDLLVATYHHKLQTLAMP